MLDDTKLSVRTYLTAVCWIASTTLFVLISAGLIEGRHIGIGLVLVAVGATLCVQRRNVEHERQREEAAFQLGRLSAGEGRIRSVR